MYVPRIRLFFFLSYSPPPVSFSSRPDKKVNCFIVGGLSRGEANVRVRVRVRAKYLVSAMMSLSANLFERISFESLISYFLAISLR